MFFTLCYTQYGLFIIIFNFRIFIYKVKDYEQGNTTNDRQSEEL